MNALTDISIQTVAHVQQVGLINHCRGCQDLMWTFKSWTLLELQDADAVDSVKKRPNGIPRSIWQAVKRTGLYLLEVSLAPASADLWSHGGKRKSLFTSYWAWEASFLRRRDKISDALFTSPSIVQERGRGGANVNACTAYVRAGRSDVFFRALWFPRNCISVRLNSNSWHSLGSCTAAEQSVGKIFFIFYLFALTE